MNNKRFIKIGNRVFAVEHIAAIKGHAQMVFLWSVGDEEPWEFEGQQAAALWAWATSLLNTSDIVEFYAAQKQEGQANV